jgi:prefoldin subunit 5
VEDQNLQTQTKHSEIELAIQKMQESLLELERIKDSLLELEKVKVGEEILSPIANGIFVESKLLSHKIKVNVGSFVVLEKTIPETIDLLDKQRKEIEKSLIEAEKVKNV